MAYAAKIGPYVDDTEATCGGGIALKIPIVVMIGVFVMRLLF